MSPLKRPESRLMLANVATYFYLGIDWLVPIVLITFLVVEWLPDAWTSWVVAVMIAVLIGTFAQGTFHWLCGWMFTRPSFHRVLYALSPPLKLKESSTLDALRRQKPTAFSDGVFSELHRDLLFKSNADAYREWCEEQSTIALHALRTIAIVRSPQWLTYAVLLLIMVI